MKKLCFLSGVILAATLVVPLQAMAKGGESGGGGGGGGNSGKTVPAVVTPAPVAVSGTSIVVPAGTAFGTVVGFAPAVPGFPPAPIVLAPTFQHGE